MLTREAGWSNKVPVDPAIREYISHAIPTPSSPEKRRLLPIDAGRDYRASPLIGPAPADIWRALNELIEVRLQTARDVHRETSGKTLLPGRKKRAALSAAECVCAHADGKPRLLPSASPPY